MDNLSGTVYEIATRMAATRALVRHPRPWRDEIDDEGQGVILDANGKHVKWWGDMETIEGIDMDRVALEVLAVNAYAPPPTCCNDPVLSCSAGKAKCLTCNTPWTITEAA